MFGEDHGRLGELDPKNKRGEQPNQGDIRRKGLWASLEKYARIIVKG
jgi:hypothetical protein